MDRITRTPPRPAGDGAPSIAPEPGAGGAALTILYEHPDWFRPLFRELDRRRLRWEAVHLDDATFDPAAGGGAGTSAGRMPPEGSVLFNRMSPSAFLRGGERGIFFALHYLEAMEARGVRVLNGSRAYRHEISKALQVTLLSDRGLRPPRTRVIHHPRQAAAAAEAIGFPVIVKPNVGGSGAGVVRFSTADELEEAVRHDALPTSVDRTLLVQEYVPPRGERITRVEVVGGRVLYAIRIRLSGETFNLCPADVCRTEDGAELTRSACPTDAPDHGLAVTGYDPAAEVIRDVEGLMAAAGIDVGGVEYLEDDRDGNLRYYDVNALSNFVADPERVVGLDPFARLADHLEEVSGR